MGCCTEGCENKACYRLTYAELILPLCLRCTELSRDRGWDDEMFLSLPEPKRR